MQRNKDNKGRRGEDEITKISKTMCYLLRHQATQHGLAIESSGFINLDDLLNCAPMKKFKVSKEMVFEIVKADNKGRYEVVNRPPYFIRAVQGHSLKSVKDEDILEPIINIFEYPVVVHGTYYEAWEMIRNTGLNKMSRNCVHFSIGYKQEDHVLSGMRNNCQVYIELNAIQAHHSGIKFFISKNKVVLSPGVDGVIPTKFVKKVVDHQNKFLYAQNYEIGVLLKFESFSANEIKGTYSIINLENKSVIHSDNLSNFQNFNQLSTLFVNKELISKSFIMIIPKSYEEAYINLIQSRHEEIQNIAFYSDYILIEDSEVKKELKEMDLSEMNAMKIKRLDIDYKKHYDNLHKKEELNEEENVESEKSEGNNNISNKNVVSDFRLTKKILSDQNISKNYLLLFLNFEEEDILTFIDYILIPDGKLEKFKNFTFKLQTKQIKENLNNFLTELKNNLIQHKVFDKLLVLCTSKSDLDYLSQKMKKNSIKSPKLFQRNIILLNQADFDTLESGDHRQAAELFLIQYVLDDSTIDKVKIQY